MVAGLGGGRMMVMSMVVSDSGIEEMVEVL